MEIQRITDALNHIMDSAYLAELFNEKLPTLKIETLFGKIPHLMESTKNEILGIAPTCFNINGNIFLLAGKTEKKCKINVDYKQRLFELQDITREKESGQSYSLYVNDTSTFKKATTDEVVFVVRYIRTLLVK